MSGRTKQTKEEKKNLEFQMQKNQNLFKPTINVKDFTGAEDIDDWLEEFDLASRFYSWDDQTKLQFAPIFLKDTARLWWKKNEDTLDDWDSLKKGLKIFFSLPQQKRLCREKLRSRNQRINESVKAYANDILRLCLQMNPQMDELEIGKFFLDGLHRDLKNKLTNWDEPFTTLKLQAELAELNNQKEEEKINAITANEESSEEEQNFSMVDYDLRKELKYLKKQLEELKNDSCCQICKKPGHQAFKCRFRYKRTNWNESNTIHNSENSVGVMKTNCKINGFEFVAIVDTGSTNTIINEKSAKKLTLKKLNKARELRDANQNQFYVLDEVLLPITLDDREIEIPATVVRNFYYDILIGNDFLSKANLIIDFPYKRIRTQDKKINQPFSIQRTSGKRSINHIYEVLSVCRPEEKIYRPTSSRSKINSSQSQKIITPKNSKRKKKIQNTYLDEIDTLKPIPSSKKEEKWIVVQKRKSKIQNNTDSIPKKSPKFIKVKCDSCANQAYQSSEKANFRRNFFKRGSNCNQLNMAS
jgi:hypothetical protein